MPVLHIYQQHQRCKYLYQQQYSERPYSKRHKAKRYIPELYSYDKEKHRAKREEQRQSVNALTEHYQEKHHIDKRRASLLLRYDKRHRQQEEKYATHHTAQVLGIEGIIVHIARQCQRSRELGELRRLKAYRTYVYPRMGALVILGDKDGQQ